ncbi:MAG: CARDB domain-containing protein, partial [bacterium]
MAMMSISTIRCGSSASHVSRALACCATLAIGSGAFAAVDLAVTSIGAPATANEAANVVISWTVVNNGDTQFTGTWADKLVLSGDAIVGDDRLLANVTVTETLDPGESYTREIPITLPQGAVGLQRVIVQTDAASVVGESNETNNTLVDAEGTAVTELYADLRTTIISAPSAVNSGESMTLQYTVVNEGTVGSTAGRFDELWASTDDIAGNADDFRVAYGISISTAQGTLAVGASRSHSITFRPPSHVPSSVRWQVRLDTGGAVNEGPTGETNNLTNSGLITVAPSDLSIAVATPATSYPGGPFTIA